MKVDCPTCQKSVAWTDEFPHRPFCSKRCQLIDLGEWAEENHRLPEKPAQRDQVITPDQIEDIEAMLAQNPDAFFKE